MKKRAFGKLYKELFYIPKYEKLTEKVFRCRTITSLLTILACTAILITSTWAWFTMNVTTQATTIESAYYSVSVDKAENGVYICPLTYEDKHEFVITASGTATTGYCKIQVGESTYYTEQIAQGQSLDLTVYAAKDTVITFTPGWGNLSNFTDETPKNPINHSTTPSTTYTVEPTARLSSIAAHYGVTEEDILIYNNLLAATVAEEGTTPLLPVGMELKIPNPAENAEPYKVPYATYAVEPTATLEDISEYYGVSISDILTFNGITELTVGNVIGIPGVSPDTPSYVAPVTETPVVDDTVSGGDGSTGEQQTTETSDEELAVLYPNDNDYYLISESTVTLKNADILIYKGKEYQKDLDLRITGIEAVADTNNKTGEYFCELLTNAETLSLCLEITENIEQGYLKIIIGESEYYTVQLKKDAYIRLDIVAPTGTEIRFEAYEGVPVADTLYGDDLKDDTDGNNPLLDHTWLISQTTQEQPIAETPSAETSTSGDEQPTTETPAIEETTTVTEQPTTEQPTAETSATEETPSVSEQPTTVDPSTETPAEEIIPTEETPTPDDTTSGDEDNGGEEPAPAGDEVPTDTGATEP